MSEILHDSARLSTKLAEVESEEATRAWIYQRYLHHINNGLERFYAQCTV